MNKYMKVLFLSCICLSVVQYYAVLYSHNGYMFGFYKIGNTVDTNIILNLMIWLIPTLIVVGLRLHVFINRYETNFSYFRIRVKKISLWMKKTIVEDIAVVLAYTILRIIIAAFFIGDGAILTLSHSIGYILLAVVLLYMFIVVFEVIFLLFRKIEAISIAYGVFLMLYAGMLFQYESNIGRILFLNNVDNIWFGIVMVMLLIMFAQYIIHHILKFYDY